MSYNNCEMAVTVITAWFKNAVSAITRRNGNEWHLLPLAKITLSQNPHCHNEKALNVEI